MGVQARYGQVAVTTADWVNNKYVTKDVGFIKVHKAFTGKLNIFEYVDTLPSATLDLGVVGYPADKTDNSEKGARMYGMFKKTTYDLDANTRHMISYKISTYGGQSGAPILSRTNGKLVAIGTHCYGNGWGDDSNSGNAIGGKWGNVYGAFTALFTVPNASYNSVVQITPAPPEDVVAEGFLDVLRSVAKVSSGVLPAAGGLLGPIGAVVGTVAGGLLGAIANQESAAESADEDGDYYFESGVAEHAVLAEAALQTVLGMDEADPTVNTLLSRMSYLYDLNAPQVDEVADCLAPTLTRTALDVTGQRLGRVLLGDNIQPESGNERQTLTGVDSGEAGDESDDFSDLILARTYPVNGGEEGAFDVLGPLLSKALFVAKPIVSKAAKNVISSLASQLAQRLAQPRAESVLVGVLPRHVQASKILIKRALLADAALSSLRSLDSDQLKGLTVSVPHPGGPATEEGAIDVIKTTAQRIGPYALQVAKFALKQFASELLDNGAGKAASSSTESAGGTKQESPVKAPADAFRHYYAADAPSDVGLYSLDVENPDAPVIMTMAPPAFAA